MLYKTSPLVSLIAILFIASCGGESSTTNNAPVAANDSGAGYQVEKGGTLDNTSLNVLSNDFDAENNPLEVVIESQPSNGTLALASNGTFVYTHNGTSSTQDSFTYRVKDSEGALSGIATVTITVDGSGNDPCQSKRIMPLGDSITVGAGSNGGLGYREPLYSALSDYSFDFVGSRGGNSGSGFDVDHEGYSGVQADWISERVNDFLIASPADIILLHIGTNDLSSSQSPAEIKTEIEDILNNINSWAENKTNIKVLLAKIIDYNPTNSNVKELNTLINAMGNEDGMANEGSWSNLTVQIVDQYGALTNRENGGDWVDRVHPSDKGYAKMAERWEDALIPLLNQQCNES